MLAKIHRLPRQKIQKILKTGHRQPGLFFDLIILKPSLKDPTTPLAFGSLVPRHLDKRSTKRNRTRRLFSQAIFSLSSQIKPGFQIVIVAKKILDQEKLPDILPSVEKALKKAHLLP